jgi:hypothetical protein
VELDELKNIMVTNIGELVTECFNNHHFMFFGCTKDDVFLVHFNTVVPFGTRAEWSDGATSVQAIEHRETIAKTIVWFISRLFVISYILCIYMKCSICGYSIDVSGHHLMALIITHTL